MKKGSKPVLFFIFFLLITYSLLILGYVAVKQECELLIYEKEEGENRKILDFLKNEQVSLIAEIQHLTSEERIVKIASEELNMIKRTEPKISLIVSKEKIEKIKEELKARYE